MSSPHAHWPGTDRMCKAVVRHPKVIDILASALANAENGICRLDDSEWRDGTRSDLILIPLAFDTDLRPIIVEFQRVVDDKFMKRASYRYGIDPILLIVCIELITGSPKICFNQVNAYHAAIPFLVISGQQAKYSRIYHSRNSSQPPCCFGNVFDVSSYLHHADTQEQ